MAGVSMEDVHNEIADLDEQLADLSDPARRRAAIERHISKMSGRKKFTIPEFAPGLDWLNVSEPLTFEKHLAGKVVVMDFFTYCCINCMHVLPDLHALESQFPQEDVLVVGVHSAKFLNEKITANILSAILRYDIRHPVVNDSSSSLWQLLMVTAWPTFVIVGPEGEMLYTLAGEHHREQLIEFMGIAVDFYRAQGKMRSTAIPMSLEKDKLTNSTLSFPGKVCISPDDYLVISDTGHHRVIIASKGGVIEEVIGSGEKGARGGNYETAQFCTPQGLACYQRKIFVADSDNHLIYEVDRDLREVRILAGTGRQGEDKEGGGQGTTQPLSSPWDLALGTSPDGLKTGLTSGATEPDLLYIAMAGLHQIWIYCLTDLTWLKNRELKAEACLRVAGSGMEENRNNSYPEKAAFAQPSGLAVLHREGRDHSLYVADSESSSVRAINLHTGAVTALVGGERDPMNLFAFGDVDGVGFDAKLQHPLGVALVSGREGSLLVADSYNHKIKEVDLKTKRCRTILGTGPAENVTGDKSAICQLNEPGGLCVDERQGVVYIADTNNHTIKTFSIQTGQVQLLPIVSVTGADSGSQGEGKEGLEGKDMQTLPTVELQPGGHVILQLTPVLPADAHLNLEAPNMWRLHFEGDTKAITKGKILAEQGGKTVVEVMAPGELMKGTVKAFLAIQLFVCASNDTCTVHHVHLCQPISVCSTGAKTSCGQGASQTGTRNMIPCASTGPRRMYRAAVCTQLKQPLEIKEMEMPRVTAGKVLIAVKSAGVNFADCLRCQGTYQEKTPLPFVAGSEIAGLVEEVGEGVSNVKKGDHVVAASGTGGFAEYCLMDSKLIFPLPEGISSAVAVAALTSYGTATLAIKRRAQIKKGLLSEQVPLVIEACHYAPWCVARETVLVTAAAGATGLAAVDIAAHLVGATVIGVCGGPDKCRLVLERGATYAIDYNKEDIRERVKELTGGKGVDVVLDQVGGDIFTQCLRSLAQEGRLVTIGYASGKIPSIQANYLLLKSCTVMGVFWGNYSRTNPKVFIQTIIDSFQAVAEGKLHPYYGLEFPLSQVNEAMRSMMDRKSTGKVVLKIQD